MKKAALLLFVMISFFLVPVTNAQIIFHEGFEYADSPENHGWSFRNPSNEIYTTTETSYSGQRSVRLYQNSVPDTYLDRTFGDISNVNSIRLAFYDSGQSNTNWDAGALVSFDGQSKYSFIRWYNPSTYQVYYDNGAEAATLTTGISRTVGWHLFEWVIKSNGLLDAYIDDTLAAGDLMTVTSLYSINPYLGTEPSIYAFYDDITVTGTVPAPTALWLLGSGLIGIAGIRRKRSRA